jgi:hypothetical protein
VRARFAAPEVARLFRDEAAELIGRQQRMDPDVAVEQSA